MRCYQHPNNEAIGVCSVCFKAICHECARESAGKLICSFCHAKNEALKQKSAVLAARKAAKSARNATLDKLMKYIFPHRVNVEEMPERGAEMITPIFFGGLIAGILVSVPFLNILFVPIILLGAWLSVLFLRAEEEFEYAVGESEAEKVGALSGLVAVFVSVLMVITFETLFAQSAYATARELFSFLATTDIDLILKISGLDKDLSLSTFQLRFILSAIVFPVIGAYGGKFAAKKMR